MTKRYAKLFYNRDDAETFAEHVQDVAAEVTVPAGKVGRPYSIFAPVDRPKMIYRIDQDVGSNQQDVFYVRYAIGTPNGASHADMILAKRQAIESLESKYEEIGPYTGKSIV